MPLTPEANLRLVSNAIKTIDHIYTHISNRYTSVYSKRGYALNKLFGLDVGKTVDTGNTVTIIMLALHPSCSGCN